MPVGTSGGRHQAVGMGPDESRRALALAVPEKDFQAQVLELAGLRGWRSHHEFDSRRSSAGWPDLVLCRPPVLLLAELKSEVGKPTAEQEAWLDDLGRCTQVVTRLWRPSMWADVEAALR